MSGRQVNYFLDGNERLNESLVHCEIFWIDNIVTSSQFKVTARNVDNKYYKINRNGSILSVPKILE